jgi:hypothetical protein
VVASVHTPTNTEKTKEDYMRVGRTKDRGAVFDFLSLFSSAAVVGGTLYGRTKRSLLSLWTFHV